jgi:hypothetical protein
MDDNIQRASEYEIRQFLKAFRQIPNDNIYLVPRSKNSKLINLLVWSDNDVKNYIKSSEEIYYFKGPKRDFKKEGEVVWEFKSVIETDNEILNIYIKLQVRRLPSETAYIISFHRDEY